MKKTLAAAALALVTAATGIALAPTASATALACKVSAINTGGNEGTGTLVVKYGGSCHDVNLTYSYDRAGDGGDAYAGRYRKSSGAWVTGSKGYVWAYDGYHSVNDSTYWLLTDLNSGVTFTVASAYDSNDYVEVTH